MPDSLADLLTRSLDPDPATRPRRVDDLAGELIELYPRLTGVPYQRSKPDTVGSLADGLNNQALSMLDLGHPRQAEQLWDAALRTDPQHPQSVYNRGLYRWRRGEITDEQLLEALESVRDSHPSDPRCAGLLAAAHLEAGRGPDLPPPRILTGHTREVRSLVVSDDGSILVSGSSDGTVRVWDLVTGVCRRAFHAGHKHGLSTLAVSANMRVAITSEGWDSAPRLWDLPAQRFLHVLTGHTERVTTADIDADGHLAVSGATDGTVLVWDVGTGRRLHELPPHEGAVHDLVFAGGGRHVLSASTDDPFVRISEVRTGRVIRQIDCGTTAGKILLSPGDRYLVTLSRDPPDIKIWDVGSGRCLRRLPDHPGGARSMQLSPDGRLLAVGCGHVEDDSHVEVWRSLPGHGCTTLPAWGFIPKSRSARRGSSCRHISWAG